MKVFPVLMYHSISRASGPLRKLGVSPGLLADQLGLLRSHGYELMGLTEALALAATNPSRAVVALTFDDGYRDFLDAAVPVLEAVGARATLYVPTMFIGGPASWLGADAHSLPPLLSWSELRDCVGTGRVEIGSHSHTHSHLDTLLASELHAEVVHSKKLLEDGLHVPVTSFCYPHGYHSRPVREAVRDAAYDNACEVGRRLRTAEHRWNISRLAVEPMDTPKRVLSDVGSGGPVIVPRAKRALQPAWRRVRRHSARKRSRVL
jgi:peptidoglycan/xylan/chitin deacetylase (PgdA/CDA1 family)